MKCKLIALLLVCIVMTSNLSYAMDIDDATVPLSQLTEEECLAFIVSQGLQIPEELQEYEGIGEFVKDVIVSAENNPDVVFVYNYGVTLKFANDIKEIVNNYYGVGNEHTANMRSMRIGYSLVDSETVGVWDEIFTEYNCYAYVLGYTSSPTNEYFPPNPGYFSSPEEFAISDPVSEWAKLTVKDLKEKGYPCVYSTTSYSDIMEYENTHTIICLRKGNYPDFHYMRWEVNSWYHKPGNTHILKYLYYRPDIKDWTNEGSFRGVDMPPTEGKSYSGTIYYFAFNYSHGDMQELGRTGNHYHSGSKHYFEYSKMCEDCGTIIEYWVSQACGGPPCSIQIGSVKPEEFTE